MSKELARELIQAGIHFGHGVSRRNPKMDPYIYGKRGMIHIINVRESLKGLIISKKLLAKVVSEGKDVVFVGTKRQAQGAVKHAAEKCGMHYVSERWLGGTLTNFRTIRSRLQRLEELEDMEATGKLEAESKKQGARLKRELRKIKTNLDGIRRMNRIPGAVVVVDARKEYIAPREARKLGVVTIGIIDTDSDPDTLDVAIPANDDSIKAIEIMMDQLAQAVAEGKTMVRAFEASEGPAGAPKKRSRRKVLASASSEKPQESEAPAAAPVPAAPQPPQEPPAPEAEQAQPEESEEKKAEEANTASQ